MKGDVKGQNIESLEARVNVKGNGVHEMVEAEEEDD